jgi:hypothetical protein
MSLWDSLNLKTTDDAMIFNQLYNTKAMALMSRSRPLLYAGLGIMTPAATPLGETTFKKLTKVTGNKVEIKVMGKTVTPKYLATPADELAAVDFAGTYANDYWGAMEFALAHLAYTHPLPDSEIDRIGGDEAKTNSFYDETFQLLVESWLKMYGTEFHAAQAPARNAIGGWPWALSDGIEAAGAYKLYGLLDRSVAGNEDSQAYVLDCSGSFTMKKFRKMRNRIKRNGGTAKLAVVNEDGYTEIETMLDGYAIITADNGNEWRRFDGEWVQFGRVKFALDADCPASQVGLFDTDYVAVWANKSPFTRSGVMPMQHRLVGTSSCFIPSLNREGRILSYDHAGIHRPYRHVRPLRHRNFLFRRRQRGESGSVRVPAQLGRAYDREVLPQLQARQRAHAGRRLQAGPS